MEFAPVHVSTCYLVICERPPSADCLLSIECEARSSDGAMREAMSEGWRVDPYGTWHCPPCAASAESEADFDWWLPERRVSAMNGDNVNVDMAKVATIRDGLADYEKCWHAQRCILDDLPRLLAELETAGFRPWQVLLEHSEYTVISYMSAGERERRGIQPLRLDRHTVLDKDVLKP